MVPGLEAIRKRIQLAQTLPAVDPSVGNVHLTSQPSSVKTQDASQLAKIRTDFMANGIATPVRLDNGKMVIIAHGAPPQNGERQWFIGPTANQFGSTTGWLGEKEAKQWAAAKGYPGAEFISCYHSTAFDNSGPIELGVPTNPSSTEFTVRTK